MNIYVSNNTVLSCGMEQSCESWPKSTCLLTSFLQALKFRGFFMIKAIPSPVSSDYEWWLCTSFVCFVCLFVCLFVCFHNSKVGPKKTNIPGHFVILFELYWIWKVLSLLMYNRQRYRMSENNRPLRNGSMNLVRMRWPRKKGGPGDGTS